MSPDLTWTFGKLAAVALLIAANGFFVAAEFALVGVRRSRVDELAATGSRAARRLQQALDCLDTNLAATQLGVTLASLGLGWIGESTLGKLLEPAIALLPISPAAVVIVAGALGFALVTVLAITLGELAPKNLALETAERTALAIIGPLVAFRTLLRPVIALLNALATGLLRLLGLRGGALEHNLHSPEELKMLVAASTDGGLIEGAQQEVVERAFDMTGQPVRMIMTPRREVVWVDADASSEERMTTIRTNRHALTLVSRGKLDAVVGVVRKQDLLDAHLDGLPLDPVALAREPVVVPDESTVLHVLELFKGQPAQLAVVVDEYGIVQGIVTHTDLLEAMAGDIPDEDDRATIVEREDGALLVDGATPYIELASRLELPAEVQPRAFQTAAGFCLHHLGNLPAAKAAFQVEDWNFEIVDLDEMRIDRILATRVA